VRVEVDLQATAHVWLPGHWIRLEVSSSEFPTYDRNLNTGASNEQSSEWRVAHNVVHHSQAHPSYLELPAIG
jgi:predicted acyl esterase